MTPARPIIHGLHTDHSGMTDQHVYQCRECRECYATPPLFYDHVCPGEAVITEDTYAAEIATTRDAWRATLLLLDEYMTNPCRPTPADEVGRINEWRRSAGMREVWR